MKTVEFIISVVAFLLFACALPVEGRTEEVRFEVKPSSVRECDPPIVATVSWDATAAGVRTVKIFVSKEGSAEKLFANLGAEGDTVTGNWVSANTVFILKDETGRQLGRFVIGSTKCVARQSGWEHSDNQDGHWRSRREDDCRGTAITQAIFS
jgi:hypothetical protein